MPLLGWLPLKQGLNGGLDGRGGHQEAGEDVMLELDIRRLPSWGGPTNHSSKAKLVLLLGENMMPVALRAQVLHLGNLDRCRDRLLDASAEELLLAHTWAVLELDTKDALGPPPQSWSSPQGAA